MPEGISDHWNVAFAVDDAYATADKCVEMGGPVVVPLMYIRSVA